MNMEKLSTILCQLVCMLWQELQRGDKAGPRMAVKQGKPNSARTPSASSKELMTEQQLRACVRACITRWT